MTPAPPRHRNGLAMPWAHRRRLYCAPGRAVLKLSLGEAPDRVPTAEDVRRGAQSYAERIDGGGRVDRALSHFSDRLRVSRVYAARASLAGPIGRGHTGYDALEHAVGLSRTFRLDVDDDAAVGDLVDSLRQLGVVDAASPYYFCTIPFHCPPAARAAAAPDAPAADAMAVDAEQAWAPRDMIRAREAMAYEPGDPAVIVAVADTGVAPQHAELRARLRRGYDAVDIADRDLAGGVRLVGDHDRPDNDPDDAVGHGTSLAAIIGAAGDRVPPGLAGGCGLLPIRVLAAAEVPNRDMPIGLGAIANIDRGMKRAIDLGARVINMSFGTPESSLDPTDPMPHADVVRYGLARGCVLVAAAGNSGQPARMTPACLDGVIAVSAADEQGRPAGFSTSGPHVAVGAPGVGVLSAGRDGYELVTGTSFASPFVAAAAALLVSRAAGRGESIDGPDVRRLLAATARPWPAGCGDGHGAGVIDVLAALQALDQELDRREADGAEG